MNARSFVNACRIIMNIDKHDLEAAGVMKPGQIGGSDWDRLNRDPFMFLLKLPDARLERLWALIEKRQPKPDASFHTCLIVERLIRIKDRLTDRAERDAINEAVAAIYKTEELAEIHSTISIGPYKGYSATVSFYPGDELANGIVDGLRDTIHFAGKSIEELVTGFHGSVDDYLNWCAEDGVEPEKPSPAAEAGS